MKPSAWLAIVLLLMPCLALEQAATAAPASAPDKQKDYNKIVDHFFAKVKVGNFTDAAHVLVDTNPQDAFNVDKHEALAVPLEKIQDAFGPFKEFKTLVTKTIGDGVGYVYVLAIYERNPVRFEFMFYQDGADWRLLHVDFNLNYVPEIRDLAGVHVSTQPAYAPAPAVRPETPEHPEPPEEPLPPPVPQPLSTPAAPPSPPAATPAPPPAATPPASAPTPSPTPQP